MNRPEEFDKVHGLDFHDIAPDLAAHRRGTPIRIAGYSGFYRVHKPKVLRLIKAKAHRMRHRIGSRIDVEGAIQEAFLALWRHLNQCEINGTPNKIHNPETWVRAVAWFQLNRQVDRGAAQQQKLIDQKSNELHTQVTSTGDPVFTVVLAAEVVEQILALPGNQKLVAYLRFVLEWSNDEIAEVLGITSSTVRVHAHRARHNIVGGYRDIGDDIVGGKITKISPHGLWREVALVVAVAATAAGAFFVLAGHSWYTAAAAGVVALVSWTVAHVVGRNR